MNPSGGRVGHCIGRMEDRFRQWAVDSPRRGQPLRPRRQNQGWRGVPVTVIVCETAAASLTSAARCRHAALWAGILLREGSIGPSRFQASIVWLCEPPAGSLYPARQVILTLSFRAMQPHGAPQRLNRHFRIHVRSILQHTAPWLAGGRQRMMVVMSVASHTFSTPAAPHGTRPADALSGLYA